MKIKIFMKTPDAVYYAADENCDTDEDRQAVEDAAAKFFEYGECVTLELDTVEKTCEVVPL